MSSGKSIRQDNGSILAPRSSHGIHNSHLLMLVTVLTVFGLIMVFSATVISSDQSLTLKYHKFFHHLAHIAISLLAMWAVSHLRIRWIKQQSKWLMGIAIAMLILVLMPGIGVEINGSRRWVDFGLARIQPAELGKILIIVYFAAYLSQHRQAIRTAEVWMHCLLVLGPVSVLLLLQPDLGMMVVVAATVGAMLFIAGGRILDFLKYGFACVAAMAVLILAVDYRRERLFSYFDPFNDATGSGFQLVQSLIAIGRGEWLGVGLGNSIQKLFYLPHGENDFLIAIVGEELGSVGIIAILLLFAALIWKVYQLARRRWADGDLFSCLLALGIGFQIAFQSFVHVGVNIGLLPTTGLTMPFISYGGSSMLSSMVGIGLLLAIERHAKHVREEYL